MSSSDRDVSPSILICLLYYVPHRTGLTLYVRQLAEGLAARGHRVTVLCARHSADTPLGESVENGVRVVRLWPLPFGISRGMILPGYPRALARLIREHDVVSVHTPMLETALIGLAARAAGKRVVVTHHGDLVLPAGALNRIITTVMFAFYRTLANAAPALVCHTLDYARHSEYLSPYLEKVVVIPPFVDVPVPDAEKVRELRQAWAPDGGPIIGFAGRFVEEKRPDLLIRSLEVVNRTFPGARIVFAGQHEIPYETYWPRHQPLVDRFRDQLVFLGIVPSTQEMADFYAACDVLALPSDTECFALVQVEAMLCGTPVVMTDTPGGRVPVQLTGMGKIVPRDDWRALGEGIVEVLSDRERFVQPVEEIERHFSAEVTIGRYEELFRMYGVAGVERDTPGIEIPGYPRPSSGLQKADLEAPVRGVRR
ncbi:MAG TPA: glycosyltransferase family 4 protein [Thermoanaerobaculia bacterium]|jgi:glycosyltransferase involved in cell wall biosynthesis|nr:glycosyltransferase family 4 protein [Thermoanaerobaculia bacterium]